MGRPIPTVSLYPAAAAFPKLGLGRRPHWTFRGLLNVHWRLRPVGSLHRLKRHICLEGSDGFVSSTVAPIATGWSDPVAGWELHPLKTNTLHGSRRTSAMSPFFCLVELLLESLMVAVVGPESFSPSIVVHRPEPQAASFHIRDISPPTRLGEVAVIPRVWVSWRTHPSPVGRSTRFWDRCPAFRAQRCVSVVADFFQVNRDAIDRDQPAVAKPGGAGRDGVDIGPQAEDCFWAVGENHVLEQLDLCQVGPGSHQPGPMVRAGSSSALIRIVMPD